MPLTPLTVTWNTLPSTLLTAVTLVPVALPVTAKSPVATPLTVSEKTTVNTALLAVLATIWLTPARLMAVTVGAVLSRV